MTIKFAFSFKGKTLMYPSMYEAMKMAKFVGVSLAGIKEIQLWG